MSESDNKVFDFGIGGFSQGHSSLEIRGDGDAYSYRHSASFLADTEEHRGGARQVEGRRAHGIPPRPRRLRLPRGLQRTAVEEGRNFLHDIDAFVHASPST